MDLIADFAKPLPTRVIGELLGVPEADQIRIGDLAGALNPVLEFLPMSPAALSVANQAVIDLAEYFRDLAASKRAQPGDDLYMAMVHAADNAGLDGDELIANAIISLRARISAQSSLTHAQAVPNRGAACAICLLALAKIEPAQVLPVASPMTKAKT